MSKNYLKSTNFSFSTDFRSYNIKYAVFVGRFQPFLRKTHLDYCLKGIADAKLVPILFFGSSDSLFNEKHQYFDWQNFQYRTKPNINSRQQIKAINYLNNPLSDEERLEQLNLLLKAELEIDCYFGGFLEDKFDNELWFLNLINKLESFFKNLDNGDSIKNCVFFRVSKDDDSLKDQRLSSTPLSEFDVRINNSDFAGVLDPGGSEELLEISATKYRKTNIYSCDFKENVVAHKYISNLVEEVRANSYFGQYLQQRNIELTMLDLALARFFNVLDVKLEKLYDSNLKNVDDLESFLKNLIT